MTISLRSATKPDVPAIAGLFALSRQVALPFLPVLHTAKEDLVFFAGYLDRGEITLAEHEGRLLGFVAQTPGWIDHLYLDPPSRGRRIGTQLVDRAKSRQNVIQLWCFEENLAARGFYRAQGFSEVRRTEGDNEEGLPDILLVWERSQAR